LPRRYDLRFDPDLDAARFDGQATIEVDVVEPVTEIVLNALELDIDVAWVECDGTRFDATVALD
jgi:hypothetical protein